MQVEAVLSEPDGTFTLNKNNVSADNMVLFCFFLLLQVLNFLDCNLQLLVPVGALSYKLGG